MGLFGGGGGGLGGITKSVGSAFNKDLMFGKEEKAGMIGQDQELLKRRNKGLHRQDVLYRQINRLNKESPDFLRGQVAREQEAIGASAEDAKRRMQQMMAQRGLGNSSIGLGQTLNIDREAARKKALIGASLGERERNLRLQGIQNLMSANSPMLGLNPGGMYNPGGRKGGLAGIAGAAIGGSMGGVGGAQLGAGIGQGLSSVF